MPLRRWNIRPAASCRCRVTSVDVCTGDRRHTGRRVAGFAGSVSAVITTKPEGMASGCRLPALSRPHGGRLWMEPNPGGGSLFHFTVRCMIVVPRVVQLTIGGPICGDAGMVPAAFAYGARLTPVFERGTTNVLHRSPCAPVIRVSVCRLIASYRPRVSGAFRLARHGQMRAPGSGWRHDPPD